MRILQVHAPYRQRGGEDATVEREARVLIDGGHDVMQYQVPNPVDLVPTGLSLLGAAWNPIQRQRAQEAANRFRPEIAHIHNTWFSLSPAVIGAFERDHIPVLMTLHNYRLLCVNGLLFRDGGPCELCVGKSLASGVRYRCYRDSITASALVAGSETLHRALGTWSVRVDRFVVFTDFARDLFIEGGVPAEKLGVKPHFVPDPGPRLHAPSESRDVLFVGRLSPEKGVNIIIEAWARAAPKGLTLRIIGDGPSRGDLVHRAGQDVEFLGPLPPDQVSRLMTQARALLFPSLWYETFGLTMIEAMAAGLPVLASRLGGIPEVMAGLPPHSLVTPGSAEAWASALAGLEDRDLVDDWGKRARDVYVERYTPSIGLRNLEGIYQSLISEVH